MYKFCDACHIMGPVQSFQLPSGKRDLCFTCAQHVPGVLADADRDKLEIAESRERTNKATKAADEAYERNRRDL